MCDILCYAQAHIVLVLNPLDYCRISLIPRMIYRKTKSETFTAQSSHRIKQDRKLWVLMTGTTIVAQSFVMISSSRCSLFSVLYLIMHRATARRWKATDMYLCLVFAVFFMIKTVSQILLSRPWSVLSQIRPMFLNRSWRIKRIQYSSMLIQFIKIKILLLIRSK